jgi:hypothetical protein
MTGCAARDWPPGGRSRGGWWVVEDSNLRSPFGRLIYSQVQLPLCQPPAKRAASRAN